MNKQKWIIVMTAVGLLGTTAVVGAAGMVDKVSGLLRKDVVVSVNGETTSMNPVYINGKAYLPARDAASALGYELDWNGKGREIVLKDKVEEPEQYMQATGVIVDIKQEEGKYRIELMGKGPTPSYAWVILYADQDTVLTGADGQPFAAKDLQAGMHITADYGPMVVMSFPSSSHAAKIVVGEQRLIKEDIVQSVQKNEGWQIHFGLGQAGDKTTTLILNVNKETNVLTRSGEPVELSKLAAGTKVLAYYGPAVTKSIPSQSTADLIVVLPDASTDGGH